MSRPLLIILLLVLIIWWLLELPRSAQLLGIGRHVWYYKGIHIDSQANCVQLGTQYLSYTAVIGSLGFHPFPHFVELGLLSLNCWGQVSDGGVSLSRPRWARGLYTRRAGLDGLLSHLQCNNSLDGLRVKRAFWLQNFLARGIDPLGRYQLHQQYRVRDTSRALSNSMVDVGINPSTHPH